MKFRHNAYSVAMLAALSAVGVSQAATVSPPTTVIYGGGATLPAIGYIGTGWLGASPNLRDSNTLPPPAGVKTNPLAADKGSLFNQYAVSTKAGTQSQGVVGVSYCQTGSGAARRILSGNTSKGETSAKGACGDYGSTPTGFGAPSTQLQADFGASDVPLSQAEVTRFVTNAGATPTTGDNPLSGRTQVVQLPAVAGAVAVVYNIPSVTAKQLNLTQADICGIFDGSITNTNQLVNTPKNASLGDHTLTRVYRSDGSGTTFSFTNYLSKVCPAAIGGAVTGFRTTDTFGGTATSGGSQQAFPTFPSNAGTLALNVSPQSGNGNVVGTVAGTAYSIGYAEVSDAVARAKTTGGGSLKIATVSIAGDTAKGTRACNPTTAATVTPKPYDCVKNPTVAVPAVTYTKFDPSKNLLKKGATSIAVTALGDSVLNGIDANGRPVVTPVTGLASGSVAGCLGLIDPSFYAAPVSGDVAKYDAKPLKDGSFLTVKDYDRYPILAISYLLAYNGGNSTKLSAVQGLLNAPYSATVTKGTKTIGKTTGYALLSLTNDASLAGTDVPSFVSACVGS